MVLLRKLQTGGKGHRRAFWKKSSPGAAEIFLTSAVAQEASMFCHKKKILKQISYCLYPNKGIKPFWLSYLLEPLHGNGWVCTADHALHLAIYLVEVFPVQFQQHQRESRYRCRCRQTFTSSFYGDVRQLHISCSWTLSILVTQDTQYLYCLGKQK